MSSQNGQEISRGNGAVESFSDVDLAHLPELLGELRSRQRKDTKSK